MKRPITAWRSRMNGGAVARVMSRAALETLIGEAQQDLTALHKVAVIAQDYASAHKFEAGSTEHLELCEKYGVTPGESFPLTALTSHIRVALTDAVKAAAP